MRVSLIVVCLAVSLVGFSGTIDSLENVLKTAVGDKKVKTLNELFRAYLQLDPVQAIAYTRQALTLATDINDKKGMAASYNNLGVAYRNQGALEKALEYYLASLSIYEQLNNKEGIATAKNNIGTIYSLKKDYGQAMKNYEESHAIFTEIGDEKHIIGAMNNLGNLHSELQLYEQALKYYSQAWQLSEKMKKPLVDPLNNIGNLYFKQGNYQRAVSYYDQAMKLANANQDNLTILNIRANLGEVYMRAGDTKKAEQYLQEALTMSRNQGSYLFEPQILKSLAGNYFKQGKMKEAYLAMLEYDQAREKIFGEESSRKIAQMEIALHIQEKEKEFEQLKKEDEIKTLELNQTRLVITLVVLALGAVIALFNLFYSKRKTIRA